MCVHLWNIKNKTVAQIELSLENDRKWLGRSPTSQREFYQNRIDMQVAELKLRAEAGEMV